MGNQEELAFFRLEGARKYLECIGNWQCFGDVETRRSLVLEGLMLMGEDKQTYIYKTKEGFRALFKRDSLGVGSGWDTELWKPGKASQRKC